MEEKEGTWSLSLKNGRYLFCHYVCPARFAFPICLRARADVAFGTVEHEGSKNEV